MAYLHSLELSISLWLIGIKQCLHEETPSCASHILSLQLLDLRNHGSLYEIFQLKNDRWYLNSSCCLSL